MTARRPNGFTLIEILAALAVLGLLIAGLGQGIGAGLRAWNTATKMTDAGNSLDTVDRTLRRLVAHMDPGGATELAKFSAQSHTLAFITTLPDMPAMPTNRVEASLGVDAHQRLVLRWRPYLRSPRPPNVGFNEIDLLGGIAGMQLSYWGSETGWVSDWRADDIPPLVRIRLTFTRPGQRPWPDIIVAPEFDRP